MSKGSLAITTGSTPGIGPHVVVGALNHLSLNIPITVYATTKSPKTLPDHIEWHHVKATPSKSSALEALLIACKRISEGHHGALVTGPVSKSDLKGYPMAQASRPHNIWGHTEILGDFFKSNVCMMFMNAHYRVALITQHIPLRDVASQLNKEQIVKKGALFLSFFKKAFK